MKRTEQISPVSFVDVQVSDRFWAPRIRVNQQVTIPFAFQKCEETGRVQHFLDAAATLAGEDPAGKPLPGYPFDDTDIYKVIEGAAYCLGVERDPALEAYIGDLIEKVAAAQEPDGYLFPARTINPAHPHEWAGAERWEKEQELSHELYNLGHLYEAAVAYAEATGDERLVEISLRSVDLLAETFGPGMREIWPGHQVIEMGLAKLHRHTGREDCLTLAQWFLDCRRDGGEYWQAHRPVTEQTEATGHAVRAAYMYTGMVDLAILTGRTDYADAATCIWDDVAQSKLYITGGIGATGHGEAFAGSYDLPNASAYAETCAAIANVYWNHRLFLLHRNAKYIDVLEKTLYNGLISGVGLDGMSFFYPNPLASAGRYERSPWFGCACCPGNIARFMASVPGYAYAQSPDGIFVNLFIAGETQIGATHLAVETDYPWDGQVRITCLSGSEQALHIRIPGWAREEASPGGLYRFVDSPSEPATLTLNGEPVDLTLDRGFAVVPGPLVLGDVVELHLPVTPKRVVADDRVAADRCRVALQRGPIIYCAEGVEQPGGEVHNLVLPRESVISEAWSEELGGYVGLSATGEATFRDSDPEAQQLNFIPYALWANRVKSQMAVWIAESPEAALPAWRTKPFYCHATVTASCGSDLGAINDAHEASTSNQMGSICVFRDRKGTEEWIEYAFDHPHEISRARLYWFENAGFGDCRMPASWRLLAWDGEWRELVTCGGCEPNQENISTFPPIRTNRVRLEIQLQEGWSGGLQQFIIE